jgi:CRP-like cAMP-binding protein
MRQRLTTPSLRAQQLRFQQTERLCNDPADVLSPKGSLALAGALTASCPNLSQMLHGRADAPVSVTVHSIDAMTSMKASSSKQFGRRMQDPSSRTNQRLAGIVEEEFRQKRLEPSSFAVAEEVSRRNVREVLELCNDFEGVGQGQGFSTFLGRARGLDILYNRPPPIVQATQDDESDSDVDEAEVLDHINAHDDFHVAVHPHLHHRTAQQQETINRVRTALERNSYFSHIEEQFGGCIDKLARCDGVSFKHVKAGTVFFRQGDCGTNCYVILSGEVGVFKFNEDRDADVLEKPSPRCADVNVIPERQQKHGQGKDSPMKGKSFAQIKGSISADQLKGVDMPKERFRTLEGVNTYNDDSLLGGCVTTLGEGVHFGELALLKDAPRAATIKCTKDCEVLVIRRSPFQDVMKKVTQKIKFFHEHFPTLDTDCGYRLSGKHVSSFFHFKDYPKGYAFMREGIRFLESHLYIVLCGTVELCRFARSSDNPAYLLAAKPMEGKSWKAICPRPPTGVAGSIRGEEPVGTQAAPDRGTQAVWDKLGPGDVFSSVCFIPFSGVSEPFSVVAAEDCIIYHAGPHDQQHLSLFQKKVLQQLVVRSMARRLRRVEKTFARGHEYAPRGLPNGYTDSEFKPELTMYP